MGHPGGVPVPVERWKDLVTWAGCAMAFVRFLRAQDCIGACVCCSVVTSHLHALGM